MQMKKVKIGKLNVAEFVTAKPVGIRGNGQFVYASELLGKGAIPSFGMALASKDNKIKLALARIKEEPDFELGILNKVGRYTKKEIISHIEKQSSLGKEITDIEVKYAEHFSRQLLGNIPLLPPVKPGKIIPPAIIPKEWKWVPKKYWRLFKSRVVFCENTTDSVTTPAANYRIAHVHKAFKNRGFEVIALTGVNDIRSKFVTEATKSRVVYLGGIGHGSYTTYTGDDFNHILEVGHYDASEVNGKVAHFLSCETGRDLGPDTITKGAKAYAGYTENFVFDWANADLYWPCDSQFDISMANGRTVEQAIADTYAKFDAAIASVPGTSTAATLLNDKNLLRSPVSGAAWGSKTARVYPHVFYHMPVSVFFS